MSAQSPITVYIFHGDDDFAIGRAVDDLCTRLLDPALADLNHQRLDGKQCSVGDIQTASMALPFMAERRVVVVSNPLAKLNSPEAQGDFREFLNRLPESTALILIIPDIQERKAWKTLTARHWLRVWVENKNHTHLHMETLALPEPRQMPSWVLTQARKMKGQIEADAAGALANHVGNDTRLATLELDKLFTYTNRQRPVTMADIDLLVAPGGTVHIFDFTDAITEGRRAVAAKLLDRMLVDQEPQMIFSMLVRTYRQLILAREVLDEGGHADSIADELRVMPFIAERLERQAKRYTAKRLLQIHGRLLEMDFASKNGDMTLDLGLQVFLAEVAG